jgi:PIN domain nuclease of toxin-antitoxin system
VKAGRLLLDTCALIWIVEDEQITTEASSALRVEGTEGRPIMISPISAWERGMLVARGRVSSTLDPKAWFRRIAQRRDIRVAELTADILTDASFLPAPVHKDPADRVLIATARALDLTLITRDRDILAYAGKGHVRALAC